MTAADDARVGVPLAPDFLLDVFHLPRDAGDLTSIYTGDEQSPKHTPRSPEQARPYVTLTFAQSLDAKIAGAGRKQLALSGKESMVMTHWMRTMHDAILIGIGTALNDDPQLNARHLPPLPTSSAHRYHLPRPVILDRDLRLPPNCKLLKNYREGRGRRPWVFCTMSTCIPDSPSQERAARKKALEKAGARVIEVSEESGKVSIHETLNSLRKLGIRSVMVEGGATVIQSFLAASKLPTQTPVRGGFLTVVDTLIVTVAPIIVGNNGVSYESHLPSDELPALQHIKTTLVGRDAVMVLTAAPSQSEPA